ncbi:hypothetical protein ATI61_10124 [Archangium gephyra]|uniref:Lipoprotein n=1 Tax=Archangium gephyra TaxID=48 RepID=A0AAC8QCQ6_9BACT|nr:hypothetical protein [Archangium gephyra]AKJ04910.1 putative lipoprotein [Archangium gephyra]REG37050.1 hypothetical protein ATI61_10124 [Archangium gephyra]
MKRLIVSLMVVAGALSSACTEEVQFEQLVGLAGTYDVALVSYPPRQGEEDESAQQLLFVTSTDSNELRVVSLEEEQTERRFLRAPNPLQPLSIPVLPRPQALTRDVRYDASGAEQSGRLVFARSSGTTLISIVDADREVLKEVRRLDTREITRVEGSPVAPAAGPVTAFAARAPEQEGAGTTLFFATQETTGARLWSAQLPPRSELGSNAAVTATPLPGEELPADVAVNSLIVLPNPVGEAHRGVLAVATRGGAGTVYRIDLGKEGATPVRQELDFGGAQVLQLATHGRVEYREVRQLADGTRVPESPVVVEAGSRIFGILDPSNCGVLLQCTGVLAVDVASGRVAKDLSGRDPQGNAARLYDMLPIGAGTGLPTGLSLATDRNLQLAAGEPADRLNPDATVAARRQRGLTLPVLGIVPLSNGTILFFDAVRLTHLNIDSTWLEGQKENIATASISFTNILGASSDASGDIRIEQHDKATDTAPQEDLTFGVTRDQTYVLTYQGILPEMASVAIKEDGSFQVPSLPRAGKGQLVQPGDLIILLSARTGGQVCATAVPVLSVQLPAEGGTLATLIPSGALPADCADYDFFQVRAAGPKPLVLSSASEDYIDRVGSGEPYEIRGPYFFHPPGYQGQTDGVVLRFLVTRANLDDPTRGLIRGERYVISTDAHFFPYLVSVSLVEDLATFRLPGPVVQATVGNKDYAYLAYPSANGVLEVDLTAITAGVTNSNGLVTFR